MSTMQEQASAVRSGRISAVSLVEAALERAFAKQDRLVIFREILTDDARAAALEIDRRVAAGEDPGPLAGVPIAVKDLFDIKGLVTMAGSSLNGSRAPAEADATIVARLKAAGAVVIGLANMDEYAYGFTTENSHYGTTRNPHAPDRLCGGSSGGSAAVVAAGIVPLSLGSDTNGSIRVPASFCGVFGLKPSFGRLSRRGAFPFVASLDHVGPFAASVEDLALCYDLMQGEDPGDPAQAVRPVESTLPTLHDELGPLRIAVLDGWFLENATDEALAALDRVAEALGARDRVELPHARTARSAAFCISAAEGAALHLANLRENPGGFDPATRDRLLAGALVPPLSVIQAQRFRHKFKQEADRVFAQYDVLLAPATPCTALPVGGAVMKVGGRDVPARPNLGIYTQPLSFIGLPVVAVPVWGEPGTLPIGVQVVTAPWREATALRVAAFLERRGVAACRIAR
jgi:AtzE family amidohydrolase